MLLGVWSQAMSSILYVLLLYLQKHTFKVSIASTVLEYSKYTHSTVCRAASKAVDIFKMISKVHSKCKI